MKKRNKQAAKESVARFIEHFGQEICDQRPFFNFGAGRWVHPLWKNIDITHEDYPNNRPEIEHNAFSLSELPIETETAHLFFFSHVNEHLTDEVNKHLFREIHRTLVPGGIARFVFPDFDLARSAYERNDRDFFLHRVRADIYERVNELTTTELFVKQFAARALASSKPDGNRKFSATELEAMFMQSGYEASATEICSNMCIEAQMENPGNHINWWNFSKFAAFLSEAGFSCVQRSGYIQSTCPPLRDPIYFDYRHPIISGYVEVIK